MSPALIANRQQARADSSSAAHNDSLESLFAELAATAGGLSNAEIQSFMYLKLAVAGHLTLFVVRTRHPFLSKPHPAPILLVAILGTHVTAALIVGFGWLVTPIAWKYVAFVWLYCLVWVFIEDWAKLHVYHHLELSGGRHRKFLERIKEPLHAHPQRS
jgi:H+-transporting ATPase